MEVVSSIEFTISCSVENALAGEVNVHETLDALLARAAAPLPQF
jgi:hypothetical protein